MDRITERNEETRIHIAPPDTTNDVEGLRTEVIEDKFGLFMKRLKDEKPPNSGSFGSVIALGGILCGKCGFYSCTFLGMILTFVVPVMMIIYGSLSLKDCPLNICIPIYLIVSGSLGLLDTLIKLIYNKFLKTSDDEVPAENSWIYYYSKTMVTVALIWFVLGAYWVYSEYIPNTDININNGLYCDKTLYYIVFWLISMVFIIIAFYCLIIVLAVCCTALFASCLKNI